MRQGVTRGTFGFLSFASSATTILGSRDRRPLHNRHSLTPWPSFPHTPAVIPAHPRRPRTPPPSFPHTPAVIPAHPRRHSREGGNPRGAGPQVGASCSAFTTSLSTGSYGMAKPYQVRQVLDAIAKMEEMQK